MATRAIPRLQPAPPNQRLRRVSLVITLHPLRSAQCREARRVCQATAHLPPRLQPLLMVLQAPPFLLVPPIPAVPRTLLAIPSLQVTRSPSLLVLTSQLQHPLYRLIRLLPPMERPASAVLLFTQSRAMEVTAVLLLTQSRAMEVTAAAGHR